MWGVATIRVQLGCGSLLDSVKLPTSSIADLVVMALPKTCSAVKVFQKHSGTLMDAILDQVPFTWKLYLKEIISRQATPMDP